MSHSTAGMLEFIKRNLRIIGIAAVLGGAAYAIIRIMIVISKSMGGSI